MALISVAPLYHSELGAEQDTGNSPPVSKPTHMYTVNDLLTYNTLQSLLVSPGQKRVSETCE